MIKLISQQSGCRLYPSASNIQRGRYNKRTSGRAQFTLRLFCGNGRRKHRTSADSRTESTTRV